MVCTEYQLFDIGALGAVGSNGIEEGRSKSALDIGGTSFLPLLARRRSFDYRDLQAWRRMLLRWSLRGAVVDYGRRGYEHSELDVVPGNEFRDGSERGHRVGLLRYERAAFVNNLTQRRGDGLRLQRHGDAANAGSNYQRPLGEDHTGRIWPDDQGGNWRRDNNQVRG